MYLKRIQLENYGPVRSLDIELPFDGERPKPVLFVGENGSGKTILLSNIVNGMINAKDVVYKESTELDEGKVFKVRSSSYISVGAEYYFARVDFDSGFFMREMRLTQPKSSYADPPMGPHEPGFEVWGSQFSQDGHDHFDTNIRSLPPDTVATVSELVFKNCLLYFPSDRMEEPAWLNKANLRARPQYTSGSKVSGETDRRVIAHSPLRDVHNWLYDVAYDRAAFEIHSRNINVPVTPQPGRNQPMSVPLPVFVGYRGDATNAYNAALNVLKAVKPDLTGSTDIRFGIGGRHNRTLSIVAGNVTVIPNLFQLSSGEIALLALFLSILRDFDLREDRSIPFGSAKDVSGLVVVDEADLHLHSRHQYEALPHLVGMFPKVQFVMTTHSPLFVLGMKNLFGDDGFHVYDLPTGSRLNAEDFDEFGEAFQAVKKTKKFSDEVRAQVEKAQRPLLYVEGDIDRDYLRRAAEVLGKSDVLAGFEIDSAGGEPRLGAIWKRLTQAPQATTKSVVLLYDPECDIQPHSKNGIHKIKMPFFENHPISKGIEHLFSRETLENARQHSSAFIDIVQAHTKTVRGEEISVPETWAVNDDEKRNLCNWLCENGTAEDFRRFEAVFEMLEDLINSPSPEPDLIEDAQ